MPEIYMTIWGAAGRAHAWQLHVMVLRPTGDGSSDHLDAEVQPPGIINLIEGLQEVGRESPADVVCAVPTVSSRHAMIRVGTQLQSSPPLMIRTCHLPRLEDFYRSLGSQLSLFHACVAGSS